MPEAGSAVPPAPAAPLGPTTFAPTDQVTTAAAGAPKVRLAVSVSPEVKRAVEAIVKVDRLSETREALMTSSLGDIVKRYEELKQLFVD